MTHYPWKANYSKSIYTPSNGIIQTIYSVQDGTNLYERISFQSSLGLTQAHHWSYMEQPAYFRTHTTVNWVVPTGEEPQTTSSDGGGRTTSSAPADIGSVAYPTGNVYVVVRGNTTFKVKPSTGIHRLRYAYRELRETRLRLCCLLHTQQHYVPFDTKHWMPEKRRRG